MMSSTMEIALVVCATLTSALMAGVYFAFSGFIMRSLDRIECTMAIAAMKSINETILKSWFMPLFWGSSLVSMLMILLAVLHWRDTGSGAMLAAGLSYFVGMFVCTALLNVPLNRWLAEQEVTGSQADSIWPHYQVNWTRWNSVRALCSLISSACSLWWLVQTLK